MDALAKELRKKILMMSKENGHGRLPSDFSIVETLIAVYRTMKHFPREPLHPERDLFILSKGHAAFAHYCLLAHYQYFEEFPLSTAGHFNSLFGCHQDRLKVPGVEVSTGSLGLGIGVSVGISLALKIKNSQRRVFTLIGDGESNEGSVWESIMVAADQKLGNLTVLYDANQSQTRCLDIRNPEERFRSFGCHVQEVNGHDISSIERALTYVDSNRPSVIVTHTQKGFGCKQLVEEKFAWHRRTPNDQEFQAFMEELDATPIS